MNYEHTFNLDTRKRFEKQNMTVSVEDCIDERFLTCKKTRTKVSVFAIEAFTLTCQENLGSIFLCPIENQGHFLSPQ